MGEKELGGGRPVQCKRQRLHGMAGTHIGLY